MKLKKLISAFTAIAMSVTMFAGINTGKVLADNKAVYEFNASELADGISTDAIKNYGFQFDTTVIWGPAKVNSKDSVYTDTVRFTTKSIYKDNDLQTLVFADDTVNNPEGATFTEKKYTFEMEFIPHYYNEEGGMYISFNGKAGGSDAEFAKIYVDYNGNAANSATMYFVDGENNIVGNPSAEFMMNNLAENGNKVGKAATLMYLKAEFDFENDTFSAWIAPRKVMEGEYTPTAADDTNKVVDNQPLNAAGIEEFVSFKSSVVGSSSTNGMWIHYVGISETQDGGDTPSEPGDITGEEDFEAVYDLDVEEIPTEDTANVVKSHGIDYDGSVIWGPMRTISSMEKDYVNAAYTDALRFTTKNLLGADGTLFTYTFTNDTVKNPEPFIDKNYVMVLDVAPMYLNQGSMYITFAGRTADGNKDFAKIRFYDYKNTTDNKAKIGFASDDDTILGDSYEFKMNNLSIDNKAGKCATVMRIKAEFDFDKNSFSAWVEPLSIVGETSLPQGVQIAQDQPLNAEGIEEFLSMSCSVTQSTATNGVFIKYFGIENGSGTGGGTTPDVPQDMTLVDEEDFSGKTIDSNALEGWEFYDKDTLVSSLPNISLSLSNNKLTIKKTGNTDETDYSERYRSVYRFKEVIEPYSDSTRTMTYKTNLEGKYQIVTNVRGVVQSGSQFQEYVPAIAPAGSTPKVAFSMAVDNSKVYEYISSSSKPEIYPSAITNKDATIKYTVDTEAKTITVQVEDGDEYVKTISDDFALQGMMYILKSKASVNDTITVNNIKLYRIGEEDESFADAVDAAEKLVITDITSNPGAVNSDLNLPSQIDGAYVSWTSSNENMIDPASGKLLDQPLGGDEDVVLTAAIAKGEGVVYKDFYVTVKSVSTDDFDVIYESDFDGDLSNIEFSDNGGSHYVENGSLILSRPGTSATPMIKIYPTWGGKVFKGTGSLVFEAEATMPEDYQKLELGLYDDSGNRITTFYTTCGSSYAYITGVGRETLSGSAVHKNVNASNRGPISMKMKATINLNTSRMTLQAAVNDGGYVTLFDNQYIRENASMLSYIQISAPSDNSNGDASLYSKLSIDKIKISTLSSNKLLLGVNNMKYYSTVEALGGYIKSDIDLVTETYPGMTATWTSSNPEILSNTGKLDKNAYTQDTPINLNFKLTLDGTDQYIEKDFPLTAVYIDPSNLAIDKTVVANPVISMTGHGPERAVDGSLSTYWQTMRFDDLPSLTVDLGEEQAVNRIDLYESPMADEYAITGYKLEVSRDNKTWETVGSGTTLGADAKSLSITPEIARYVKFTVTDKLSGLCCGLREIQIYGPKTDKEKAEADILFILDQIGSLKNLTSNVTLPTTTKYGSTITYTSSLPEYFSNTGVIERTTTTQSGTLKITAKLNNDEASKDEPFTIMKTSTVSPGGGGGGGTGGGSPSISVPALPQQSTQPIQPTAAPDTGIFNDVSKDFWGYEYIESLADRGIVSGDENRNFRPNDNISRQEFVKMLIESIDINTDTIKAPSFSDVSAADWSYIYIAHAVDLGIVNGISEDKFGKTDLITREDMAVMCRRALEKTGTDVSDMIDEPGFADVSEISDYAYEAVGIMSNMGIINGYEDNTFRPKNNATRAEAAKILYMLTE